MLFNVLTYMRFVSVFTNALIFIFLFMVLLEILYCGSIQKKLLVTLFMYLLGMGSEFLAYQGGNAMGVTAETAIMGGSRLLGAIISKLLWFTAVRAALLLWKGYKEEAGIRLTDWLTALTVPVSSIFIAAAVVELDGGQKRWMKFFAACLILMLNLLIFYLFDRVQANAVGQAEREYVRKQAKYYATLNDEIGRYWGEMQSFRHDLKQRYILEQSYLEQKNCAKLAECYKESIDLLKNGKTVANTGNLCIDNLINYKSLMAERKGIEISADLLVAYDARFDDGDICSLIGNLLDNAIEAAEDVEEDGRRVKLKIRMAENNMLITTENPYKGQRRKRGNQYLTTKAERSGHGMGLKMIEEIAGKYHGDMVIEDTGQMFDVKVLLYQIS